MNKDDLIKKLEQLDLPEIELSSHQHRLKMALLNSGYFRKNISMSLKKFAPIGIVAAVAVIAIVAVMSTGNGTLAYAKEIAQKSYQTVVNLPADQQAKVSASLGMDSRTILQEALSASDLKALTYDEFANQNPFPPDPDGKLRTMKFLQFTRADGLNVILGIDQNDNLPKFATAKHANPNPPEGDSGEKSFNTMFRDENGLVNCTTENGVEKCEKVSE